MRPQALDRALGAGIAGRRHSAAPPARAPPVAARGARGFLRGLDSARLSPSVPLLRHSLRVAARALREASRDRHTLAYTVVLPVCLYPVLFWVMVQGALVVQGRRQHTEVTALLARQAGASAPADLEQALAEAPEGPPGIERVRVIPGEPLDEEAARALLTDAQGHPDAALVLGAPLGEEPPSRLFWRSTQPSSELARRRVLTRARAAADRARRAAAEAAGRDPLELDPFEVDARSVADVRETGAYVLSFLLPLLLSVMVVMGAFVPAVDLTAGEHERGTAETTWLLPVPRLAVVLGKIAAVATTALFATLLNLVAVVLAGEHLLRMLEANLDLSIELPVGALLAVLPLLALFAIAVAAALIAIASLARTFKEGQALLGPVQMLVILPAMAGTVPGLELDAGLAWVPVVNVTLAFRELVRGELTALPYAITALSLCTVAAAAVLLAVRVGTREQVQFADRSLAPRRLLALLRSSGTGR